MDLPVEFANYTRQLMGETLFNIFEIALEEEVSSSIRLNPYKCNIDSINIPLSESIIPWCDNFGSGHYLKHRANFTFDPLFHAGVYYVQEASSMFISHVLNQYIDRPITILDLCAAPGGKSTAASAILKEGSLLISNEPIRSRAQILSENIAKFGNKDVIVTNNYPTDFKKSRLMFDVIITDVPCSGEGMFRKDEGAVREWSKQNVENCWKKQREIVGDIWDNLIPGGLLIYSTCTFNTKENEENIKWISEELGADIMPVDTDESWNITGSLLKDYNKPVYRFIPGKTKGEGLFMAVLKKNGEYHDFHDIKLAKKDRYVRQQKDSVTVKPNSDWLQNSSSFRILKYKDDFIAIPKAWEDIYNTTMNSLHVLSAGIKLGTLKGKDIIPSQSLALSTALDKSAFPNIELSYEDAIAYLRKETVNFPENTPKGYILVTYKEYPIGFEKNIGNRANNLYPQEWKIKSTHIPNEDREIVQFGN